MRYATNANIIMTQIPPRGFTLEEYQSRLVRVQKMMYNASLDAILLTTQEEIEYYTGFKTQFLQSPTRPWYVLLPLEGDIKAIIPSIGESGMRDTWVKHIQTWQSPQPKDDGISLLTQSIKQICQRFKTIGIPMGNESTLRMPLADFAILKTNLRHMQFADAKPILRQMRFIKSAAEIAKIKYICQIVSDGFNALPDILLAGQTERQNCQRFKKLLLELGVDDFPYLISGSGQGGYGSIIMGPSEKILDNGDIFIIDTGCVFDGYFCDFDRNYAIGKASDAAKKAYEIVYDATEAGFAACTIGNTTKDVFIAMQTVLQAGGALGNSVGRMGHGLGLQLTEWPSINVFDDVPLAAGTVITLEPGMEFLAGKEMVHEENVVITENGAEWLSKRAPRQMPEILAR